ncbi:hypothetical protein H5410_064991 [Solanum commersonii]|uniref:Uncharacterized protein n=1 Tax=Solanum commersonii TaxID=4109 RepID=A0A9J5VXS9_SOLCO|nr:hypothetical protein H5410_064991 [Solanum commersonii]
MAECSEIFSVIHGRILTPRYFKQIKSMREMYLSELNDLYWKTASEMQQWQKSAQPYFFSIARATSLAFHPHKSDRLGCNFDGLSFGTKLNER